MLKSRHAILTKKSVNLPKISASQLNRSAENYPLWLNRGLKSLPAIYHGVLGQVQIAQYDYPGQPNIEYHHRLTDTERVYHLLEASHLPKEKLATIWAHVNKSYPGQLTNKELCLALALIALFQRPNIKDPFSAIRTEKCPPIPILHPRSPVTTKPAGPLICLEFDECSTQSDNGNYGSDSSSSICNKNSHRELPLNTTNPYVEDCSIETASAATVKFPPDIGSILDDDVSLSDYEAQLIQSVWLKQMKACKSLYKRVFDILNVEHGRSQALEALKTTKGSTFISNFCRSYPIAYRIWTKALDTKLKSMDSAVKSIDNSMTSINECWAVLVNLFNEAGHGPSIDTLMDKLTLQVSRPEACRDADIETCVICRTNVPDDLLIKHGNVDYHTSCANFWLHEVESTLPFNDCATVKVLTPIRRQQKSE